MGRPRKADSDKSTESITMRLTAEDFEKLNKAAMARRASMSSLVIFLLVEKGAFVHKVSDEEYERLLTLPEMMQTVSQQIRKDDRRIFSSWLRKDEKKSLTYHAVVVNKCSVSLYVNKVIIDFIRNQNG